MDVFVCGCSVHSFIYSLLLTTTAYLNSSLIIYFRLLEGANESSGLHNHALQSVQDRLAEVQAQLDREKQLHMSSQTELTRRLVLKACLGFLFSRKCANNIFIFVCRGCVCVCAFACAFACRCVCV